MGRKVWLAAGLLGACVAGSSSAAEPPVVAVFILENVGTSLNPGDLEKLTDYMVAELAATRKYRLVPRSDVKRALSAAKKQSYDACYDETCRIEIGKEVAAELTLSSKIARFGPKCTLSLTLYDLKQAASAGGSVVEGGCTLLDVQRLEKDAVAALVAPPGSSESGAPNPGPAPADEADDWRSVLAALDRGLDAFRSFRAEQLPAGPLGWATWGQIVTERGRTADRLVKTYTAFMSEDPGGVRSIAMQCRVGQIFEIMADTQPAPPTCGPEKDPSCTSRLTAAQTARETMRQSSRTYFNTCLQMARTLRTGDKTAILEFREECRAGIGRLNEPPKEPAAEPPALPVPPARGPEVPAEDVLPEGDASDAIPAPSPAAQPKKTLASATDLEDYVEVGQATEFPETARRAWDGFSNALAALNLRTTPEWRYPTQEDVPIYRGRGLTRQFGDIPKGTLMLALGGDGTSVLMLDIEIHPGGDLPTKIEDTLRRANARAGGTSSPGQDWPSRIEHAGWVSAAAFRKMTPFLGGTCPGRVVPELPANEEQLMAMEEDARARGPKVFCAFRSRLAAHLADEPDPRAKAKILSLCEDLATYDAAYRGTRKLGPKQAQTLARRICAAMRRENDVSEGYAQAVLFGRHEAGGLTISGSGYVPNCAFVR